MIKWLPFILSWLLYCNCMLAIAITDIQPSDANYNAIQYALNNGYLSLYNNQEFKPNTAISRRDAAIMIKKLSPKQSLSLSTTEIQSLNQLASSYKALYANNENTLVALQHQQDLLLHDNTRLNHTVNTLESELKSLKKERKLMYILLGLSTIIGIAFP